MVYRLTDAHVIRGYQVGCPEPPVAPHGKTGFGDLLAALPADEDLVKVRAIVIAYDNDNDPNAAFHHVQQEIRRAQSGYSVPGAPLEVGPAANNLPAIIALPVPWVGEPGCLESLILPAVSDNWPNVRGHVDTLIAATEARDLVGCKRDKAILAAMIACVCGKDPTCSVSSMWRHAQFKPLLRHATFDRVAGFFRDLPGML
jgi:hypothetical protein